MLRFCLIFAVLCLCRPAWAQEAGAPPILVDQFGYLPGLNKRAVIKGPQVGFDAGRKFSPGRRYAVIDRRTGRAVFEGAPVAWRGGAVDADSGDRVWHFDFSAVRQPGTYIVRDLDRGVDSYPFEISPTVYTPVLKAAFKTLYLQRAGLEKRAPFAPRGFADRASHLGRGQDGEARRFDAMDNPTTARDLRGGWYDAGDYNQYTSWTADYVSWLLGAYLDNPAVWTDDFGIPESGNGTPDILDEARWGLAWLERMQGADGSMLSVLARDDASPPSKARGPSRYGPPNTSATVTAAGAFALAAQVYGGVSGKRYAARADRAWRWAEANPNVKFYNNDARSNSEGLAAGQQEVEADRLAQKRLIAAVQMHALTGDTYFAGIVQRLYQQVQPMSPDVPASYESYLAADMLFHARQAGVSRRFARQIRRDYAAKVLNAYNGWPAIAQGKDPYGAFVDGYWWGSNATKARRGAVFAQALVAGVGDAPPPEYLNAAAGYLHYLHGVNPLNKVYLSNLGAYGAENSVDEFYHAWFKDGTKWDRVGASRIGPAPGFLVGGPNPGYQRDSCCATTCGGQGDRLCRQPANSPPNGQPPAKSYADFNTGWPINSWEVTENSNAYQIQYIRLLSKLVR